MSALLLLKSFREKMAGKLLGEVISSESGSAVSLDRPDGAYFLVGLSLHFNFTGICLTKLKNIFHLQVLLETGGRRRS